MKQDDFQTLPKLVQEFLQYEDVAKAQAELTVREYASDLRLFFRYLTRQRGLVPAETPWDETDLSDVDAAFCQQITKEELMEFLVFCRRDRQNAARTLARKRVSVNRFLRYLTVLRQVLESNPMDQLEAAKVSKPLPKYLTVGESMDLLAQADGPYRERDQCMVLLFLNCGLRLSELVGLNLSSINWQEGKLRVFGKGSKERVIYLNDACLAALRRYLAVRPAEGLKDRDALFISRNRRRINQRSVELVVERLLEKANLQGQGFSVHKLRHTAATLMYQNNVDVVKLKEILGHENLSTTEIYTHVASPQLQEAMRQHPLSQFGVPASSEREELGEGGET
ncbi:MAG: tyrosine-type recombinase/integrase [Oscillospiraceae bacterium]|jgi:site-specific recombinase XerD|nr:tyrosine-type recombinase/integrase [Oscillospiraceae bacterium]